MYVNKGLLKKYQKKSIFVMEIFLRILFLYKFDFPMNTFRDS